jgi:hypothetical protein
LLDFHGRFSDHLFTNAGRHAFLHLYSGTQLDQWALQELITVLPKLLEYPSGVSFIAAVHERLRYRSSAWTDALFPLFESIITCALGYYLFSTIVADAPTHLLSQIARCVVGRFVFEIVPELTRLLCVIVRLFPDMNDEYAPLSRLQLYVSRPPGSPVAVALLEVCDPQKLQPFVAEIIGNINGLMVTPELMDILRTCLTVAPRAQRSPAILEL